MAAADDGQKLERPPLTIAGWLEPSSGGSGWEPLTVSPRAVLLSSLGARDRWVVPSSDPPGALRAEGRPKIIHAPIDRRTEKRFHEFCDAVLRPALYGIQDRQGPGITDVIGLWEQGYLQANRDAARAIVKEQEAESPILLQDIHMLTCAAEIRVRRPDAKVGLVLHHPLLVRKGFEHLPDMIVADILQGLLACDLLGFESHRDLVAFKEAISRFLGVPAWGDKLQFKGRTINLRVFPITIHDHLGVLARTIQRASPHTKSIVWYGKADKYHDPLTVLNVFNEMADSADSSSEHDWRYLICLEPPAKPSERDLISVVKGRAASMNRRMSTERIEVQEVGGAQAVRRLAGADVILVSSAAEGMSVAMQEAMVLSESEPVIVLTITSGSYERFKEHVIGCMPNAPSILKSLEKAALLEHDVRTSMAQAMRGLILGYPSSRWLDDQVHALTA